MDGRHVQMSTQKTQSALKETLPPVLRDYQKRLSRSTISRSASSVHPKTFSRTSLRTIDSAFSTTSAVIEVQCCTKSCTVRGTGRLWSVFYASIVASLGSFMYGFGYGFSSPALLHVTDIDFIRNISRADFTQEILQDTFGGMVTIGAAIGGLSYGTIADLMGRKKGMIAMAFVFLIGWAIVALSRLAQGMAFFGVIYTGLFIVGYGCGSATLVVPLYISEISPHQLRGLLGFIPEFEVVLGLLLVYGLGAIPFHLDLYQDLPYYFLALFAFSVSLVYLILLLTIKETPHWLVLKHRENSARSSLAWLRGPKGKFRRELRLLEISMSENRNLNFLETFKLFPKRTVWKPLILIILLMSFQELVGISAVTFYGGTIFQIAGISNPNQVAAGAIGVISVLATTMGLLLMDVLGRKILLLISSTFALIATLSMGTYFYVTDSQSCDLNNTVVGLPVVCSEGFNWLAILSIVLYVIGFSLGWGGIPWLLSSEIFPTVVRGKCMSIATFVSWAFAVIVTFSFNSYQAAVQPYGAFWTFAVFCALSFLFVLFFVPETKGKTLHEIEAHFAGTRMEDLVLEDEEDN